MRLKRLDLTGFKTFADRTALEFAPRITAIVGPNGSGKSNIFDAIRWALGEGSLRALRGVRNEDVIFAGSERRRSLGMAEVMLTLDNADGGLALPRDGDEAPAALAFAEMTVTRRALRGADSQYLINTLPCRLRDIQTMFLGTGLGGHSYALITQGEVDHMLDATPEERRMILEEAAGVAKYKRRRRDAERRMAAAEQLLLRVADILGEQDARVATLAAQAEAAQQYQAYTQELRQGELAIQIDEVRRLGRAQRRVREQLEQVAARRRKAEDALRALAEERTALERRAADAGRAWDEAQRSLVRLTERRSAEDAAVQLLEERRRGVAAQQERLARGLERCRAEEEALRRERAALDEADGGLAAEHAATQASAAEAEQRVRAVEAETVRVEERLDGRRQEARAVAEARGQARNDAAAADARTAGHGDRVAALAERLAYLDVQRAALQERRRDLDGALVRATADLTARREALGALRAEQAWRSEAREDLLARLHRAEVEREAARSQLRHLEEAHAQYRGHDAGARELLLARRADPERFGAIHGAVVESLGVPRELRPALEAALGPALSALIVDSPAAAAAVCAAWSGGDLGPVAFLPLSLAGTRAPAPLPPAAASHPAVRGRVPDLVRIAGAGEAARVIAALLADVLVVEDLDAALRVRAAGYGGSIVTLGGECVSAEGLLTTGRRTGDRKTVVGRADEIQDARARLARLEAEARDRAGQAEAAARRLREIEGAIAEAEAAASASAERRGDVERRRTLLDAEAARLEEEGAAVAAERESAAREAAAQEVLRDGLRAQADLLDARVRELEGEAASLAGTLRERGEAAREARERIAQLRVALTELAGRRAALRVRAEEADRTGAELAGRHGELREEQAHLAAEDGRLAASEAAARERRAALEQEAAELQGAMQRLDEERAATASRRTALDGEEREAAGRAEALAADAHRLEVRQAQVEAEIGGARRRIEEEFGEPADRAAERVAESFDRDETLGRIEALRGLIAALGPVNLIAIEEHRRAAARAEALRAQVDDVQGALAALRALIAHLEGLIRERFDDTFRAVATEFAALFVRLFGGGSAGLELVELEGSDEPGVDLAVQPPGKALRSLGALSGGERVMVALALIFAMLRVRPSPFCVLDEVEAALDEANTSKIAEVLQEIAERTQIIIITHNKATMEVCEVMFGVTMEEPGVSHLVSMRLEQRERAAEGQPVA